MTEPLAETVATAVTLAVGSRMSAASVRERENGVPPPLGKWVRGALAARGIYTARARHRTRLPSRVRSGSGACGGLDGTVAKRGGGQGLPPLEGGEQIPAARRGGSAKRCAVRRCRCGVHEPIIAAGPETETDTTADTRRCGDTNGAIHRFCAQSVSNHLPNQRHLNGTPESATEGTPTFSWGHPTTLAENPRMITHSPRMEVQFKPTTPTDPQPGGHTMNTEDHNQIGGTR